MEKQVKEPANRWEYIKTSLMVLRQWGWIWQEFMSSVGRRLFIWTLLIVLVDSFLSTLWPYMFKWILDGLAIRAIAIIVWSFAAIAVFEVVGQGSDWIRSRLEERLGTEQIVTLETRLTELFFGKSLGQHLGDSQELSPANIKKGQNAVRGLQKIMLYQLIPMLIKAVLFLGLLFWLHWITGLIALVFIFYSAGWSLYLNRRVMTVGQEIDEELRAVDRYMDERWRGVE
ncbi:hypothetical protein KKC47_00615, partial [Patescibacteria group bacterium]|nr:hypothetical protein [Patescibacteria group bacterium]